MTYQNATYDSTNGAAFTITESGDAPTMQSEFYIFFGEVTVTMKTAPGTGIVSTAILESDDLDEVDWEFLGGTSTNVQTNYFGKGNTSSYDREQDAAISDSQTEFHEYKLVWTEETITWLVDGSSVRTLAYADAVGGQNYPQTPMRIKLGTWAGGDSTEPEGTIEWAGGETDYSQGPFTAYFQSISIVNYNPAATYTYGDLTGSWESIELSNGTSGSTTLSATSASGSAAAAATKTGAIFASGTASAAGSSATGASGKQLLFPLSFFFSPFPSLLVFLHTQEPSVANLILSLPYQVRLAPTPPSLALQDLPPAPPRRHLPRQAL